MFPKPWYGRRKSTESAFAPVLFAVNEKLIIPPEMVPTVSQVGSLEAVEAVVSVNGYVNCVAGFPDSPKVINGASDLLVELFGDAGRHVRAAVGVNALPRNALVELQMVVLLRAGASAP